MAVAVAEGHIDLAMVISHERKQLDEILEEKQVHRGDVSVLSHLHFQ